MSEETDFQIEVKDFVATDLSTRNRFKEKLKISGEFDDKKFKSKKELIGGGDVHWKFNWKSSYRIFSWRYLEEKKLKIQCKLSKSQVYGQCSVDLHTLATGPAEHNLPILDFDGKTVGRLNFVVIMEQVSNVAVLFKSVKLRHLKGVGSTRECNPYLKYAYSKIWTQVLENKAKATYSTTQYNTTDPVWVDLPEVRFMASLKEILHESIVLHVTHQGKMTNTTLGRCNLLFRTLVDNGKSFKDEDLISFKGPLKVENAEIEGILVFKFLPTFAQMKPISVVKKAIHTEKGIFDATTLLPGLPLPKIPVHKSEDTAVPEVAPASPGNARKRSQTVSNKKTPAPNWADKDENTTPLKDDEDWDKAVVDQRSEEEKSPPPAKEPAKKQEKKVRSPKDRALATEDLISFTPPGRRRSTSIGAAASPFENVQPGNSNPFSMANPNPFVRDALVQSAPMHAQGVNSFGFQPTPQNVNVYGQPMGVTQTVLPPGVQYQPQGYNQMTQQQMQQHMMQQQQMMLQQQQMMQQGQMNPQMQAVQQPVVQPQQGFGGPGANTTAPTFNPFS